ncbi:MAG: aryl-sulfate sulfotransferase [Alphaproteobacteria bacterium]|nr:aryl-sulfate sulfotransferase [Alphaproteobacteria bacterium]MCB9697194.1 aryl-sulfate sulfotransferase [Alphaproteobacteria bacterium]
MRNLAALALLVACHGKDTSDTPTDHSETDGVTDTPPETGTTSETGGTETLAITSAELVENTMAGLTAWLRVSTAEASSLSIDVSVAGKGWTLTDAEATDHEILVLGLRADSDVAIHVTATSAGGAVGTTDLTLHTSPLPQGVAPVQVATSDPSRMEPGVTVLPTPGGFMMVDEDGQPCWYFRMNVGAREIGLTRPDNHILVVGERSYLLELDLAGRVVHRWATDRDQVEHTPLALFVTHHDIQALPNGNFLTLSEERRMLPHPTSESVRSAPWADAWVAGDVVVEFQPDGTIVSQWKLLDMLDPDRIAYDSVRGDFWENFGAWRGDDVHDWAHANAISYDPTTDTILVSLRHQDAVIGFDRGTGDLLWILGNPVDWVAPWDAKVLAPDPRPADFRYPWHQHGAQFTPAGTITMFDNGNYGVPAYYPKQPDRISRAMEVRIDPVAMTYETVWTWGDELELFSGSMGDVDLLPQTDNRLVMYGNTSGIAPRSAVVYEVTRSGDIVWEASTSSGLAWFRGARWTGIIPGPGR